MHNTIQRKIYMQKKHISLLTILFIIAYVESAEHQLAPIENVSCDVLSNILKLVDPMGYQRLIDVEINPALAQYNGKIHNFISQYSRGLYNLLLASKSMEKKIENAVKPFFIFYEYDYLADNHISGYLVSLHKQGSIKLLLLKTRYKFVEYSNLLTLCLKVKLAYYENDIGSQYHFKFYLTLLAFIHLKPFFVKYKISE